MLTKTLEWCYKYVPAFLWILIYLACLVILCLIYIILPPDIYQKIRNKL